MKRRQCSGRNAKDTGPCQATASEGFETCARCGGRRKARAARTVGEHLADIVAEGGGKLGGFEAEVSCASGYEPESIEAVAAAEQHEAIERALDAQSEAVLDANADAAWDETVILDARDDVPAVVAPCRDEDAETGLATGALAHVADSRPACGNCGACPLCDAVLAYEDAALAAPNEFTASAVSPETHRPVAEGPVEAVDTFPRLVTSHATLVQCTHQQLAAELRARGETVDMLGTDAPYSKETHDGHGTMARWGVSVSPSYDGAERREIDYAAWTDVDVREFVETWHPLTRGWLWSLTDDVLAPVWQRALRDAGRWVAPLIPCTERGMTVKRSGGGPSSCTVFLVVARPRTKEFLRWAVTESHYVVPREVKPIVGGKALELVRQIVVDYSRPGDRVCDPCAGGGGTLRVALRTGRRAIGSEPLAAHYDIAARLLGEEMAAAALDGLDKAKQSPLFDRDVMRRRRVPVAANG